MFTATPEEMAISAGAHNAGDDKLWVRFYLGTQQNEAKSKEEGRPIYEEVPYVEIVVPGDLGNVVRRPVWDDLAQRQSDVNRFPKQWAAFKNGISQDQFNGGTPIDKLPGISKGQVEELRHFKVRTVEQLASLDDVHAQRFMGVQQLKQRAKAWLAAAKEGVQVAKMQEELSKRDEMLAAMSARLAALEGKPAAVAGLQEQAAELTALEAKAELEHEKRGPGRPPKSR